MIARFGFAALAVAAALAFPAAPARADISLEGAAVAGNGRVSGGAALSLGVFSIPLTPVSGELTVAVPFDGGYAATADARLRFAATSIGAGAGFGTLGATNRTGVLYNAFLGQGIAPHTALEVRVYFGNSRPATLFAGVRLSI